MTPGERATLHDALDLYERVQEWNITAIHGTEAERELAKRKLLDCQGLRGELLTGG